MEPNDLNSCIRSELAAVETYRQALDKEREHHGQKPAFRQLDDMRREHEEAAERWRAIVPQLGGTPTSDSGAWGTWSKTVMGTAKLFGDKAALKALKEGEESGLKEYRAFADDQDAPHDVKSLAAELARRREAHIGILDRLIEAA
jgi:bacterioferritin (cytochrome b1)